MSFNVSDIFNQVFGVRVNKSYLPPPIQGKADAPQINYQGIEIIEDPEEAKQLSSLGTPILFPITFKGSEYMKYNLKGEIVTKKMGDYRLPITAIADFRRPKIVGKTRAVAGVGTVKETYGFDDWKITIRGFFLKEDNQPQGKITPFQQEEELMVWDELADAIRVEGFFFQMRNIHNLIIKEIPVQMLRGNTSLKPFIIKAESDTPLELIL